MILGQLFPNSVLGSPRGAHFVFCPSATQLIQIRNSSSSFDYLNQLCSARATTKRCTPWCPRTELGKRCCRLSYILQFIMIWLYHALALYKVPCSGNVCNHLFLCICLFVPVSLTFLSIASVKNGDLHYVVISLICYNA